MKYNSTVLSEILQVVESPEPDPVTGRPEIPPVLQPVFVPGSITRPDTTGVRNDSHLTGTTITVANGAQTITTMTTLKEGLWRITGTYQMISSVIAAPALSALRLVQASTVIGRLAAAVAHTTVTCNVMIPIDCQVTLDRDTDISLEVPATGVGERQSATCQLHCQRIL